MDLFSPVHLAIVAGIALLIFGPKRLPELGEGFGKTIRAFRSAVDNPSKGRRTPPDEEA